MTATSPAETAALEATPPPAASADDDRTAWLKRRRSGLGASDIAAILGLSPWASPWSVWADKCGLSPLDESDAEHLEFGRRAELMLSEWFEDRTGLYVAGEQMECSRPDDPWMKCTVDGFVFDGPEAVGSLVGGHFLDSALAVAEWKCTADPAGKWEDEGVPVHYQTQATWAALVTGMPIVWFGVLHMSFGRPQFRTYEFVPDADDMALIEKAAREFWQLVLDGTPPPTDGSEATTRALSEAWEPTDATVEADDRVLVHVAEHRRLTAELKRLETARDAHANAIRAALGDATVLTHGVNEKGKPIVAATWRPTSRTGFDHKALLARRSEDSWWDPYLTRFITKTTSRSLLVKSPKGDT